MSDTPRALAASVADRYRIDRELGSGGMATVYLAADLRHLRQVAIKVLRPELAAALGADRFLREIETTANLRHPLVVPLYDSGESAGFLFYVMPFVDGESLRDRLNREGSLPLADALRIARDVTEALGYAHGRGVVHRDIKPENILLEAGHAVVADFGIARAVDAAGTESLTQSGMIIGTPAYMSPEQATAEAAIDHRADIYSLGAALYEMLSGQPPFTGTPKAQLAAQITRPPEPLSSKCPDLPPRVAGAVMKCLAKNPDDRFQSADALYEELEAIIQSAPRDGQTRAHAPRGPIIGVAVVVLVALGAWYAVTAGARRERFVRLELLPEIRRLAGAAERDSAFELARRAESLLPHDSTLQTLWQDFSSKVVFRTDPPGVRVERQPLGDTAHWTPVGITPLDTVRVPDGYNHYRFQKAGYRTVEWIGGPLAFRSPVVLDSVPAPYPEMVRIPAGGSGQLSASVGGPATVRLAAYRIDQREVTSREFQRFVDAGGYRNREFWTEPFVKNGRAMSWELAMALFVDRTGRPGPATWETGQPAPGTLDLPVGGISWYEAQAYARFAGKSLPTVFHWARAAWMAMAAQIVAGSNFSSTGPRPAGVAGMSRYGALDMAGNVREWCLNTDGAGHNFILGGGWNQQAYIFNQWEAIDPFDRAPINGVRSALIAEDSTRAVAARPVPVTSRDFATEVPATDLQFAAYRRFYDYDQTPLKAKLESRDTSNQAYDREKISYDAAYAGERTTAYLFLPKRPHRPFQTVVYFPSVVSVVNRSSADLDPEFADFVVKDGRAVLYPIYKGTFERGDGRGAAPDETVFYRDLVVMQGKDFRRAIDYLASRTDVDTSRIGYFGYSLGANAAAIMLAIEPRIKAAVLVVAGLEMQRMRPEVDPFNFLPRVTTPVLMLNGQFDNTYPMKASQDPFYRLLGVPGGSKQRVVYQDNHSVPKIPMIKESLRWYDTYLGR